MKSKTRAVSKIKHLDEMTEELEKRGIDVNKESLASRVKNLRRIGDLEEAAEKKARAELGISDDSDDDSVMSDEELKKDEMEARGRRGKREAERKASAPKIQKVLGKRQASRHQDDIEMNSDDDDGGIRKEVRGSMGKLNRSLTPSQRKTSVKKMLRERTASRREGSTPQRLDFKPVPEEHVRLAKKINSVFKHKINRSEADREVNVKKPKHLFAGKMSNGKKDYR